MQTFSRFALLVVPLGVGGLVIETKRWYMLDNIHILVLGASYLNRMGFSLEDLVWEAWLGSRIVKHA